MVSTLLPMSVRPALTQKAEDGTEERSGLKRGCDVAGDIIRLGPVDLEIADEAFACNGCSNEGRVVPESGHGQLLPSHASSRRTYRSDPMAMTEHSKYSLLL